MADTPGTAAGRRRKYVFDTMTKHDPATEAGRAFDLLWPGGMNVIDRLSWRERILAIEAEAVANHSAALRAAVERLPGMNGRHDAIGGALEVDRAAVLALLDHPERLTPLSETAVPRSET